MSSNKKVLIVRSSTKAEYISKLLWLESLLSEIHIEYIVPIMLCDNLSVILVSQNPILHAKTKHIYFDIHFVKVKVLANHQQIQHVLAYAQLADALTKLPPTALFMDFWNKLKVALIKPSLYFGAY